MSAVSEGSLCVCGHGMNEHYLCGAPESRWCLHRDGCPKFTSTQFAPESSKRRTIETIAEHRRLTGAQR